MPSRLATFSLENKEILSLMFERRPRDVEILLLRSDGLTLDKIAKKVNLSRERVRQIIERAILCFKSYYMPRMDIYENAIRKKYPHEAYYRSWHHGTVHCYACPEQFSVAIPPHFSQFQVRCPHCGEKITLKKMEDENVQKA